jgi:hypothetical protein
METSQGMDADGGPDDSDDAEMDDHKQQQRRQQQQQLTRRAAAATHREKRKVRSPLPYSDLFAEPESQVARRRHLRRQPGRPPRRASRPARRRRGPTSSPGRWPPCAKTSWPAAVVQQA